MSRRQKAPGELGKFKPRRLSSGRWQARVEIRDGAGQRVPLSAVADTEAGAILAIAEKANAVWSGAFFEVTPETTIEAVGTIWINQMKEERKQSTSVQSYQTTLRTVVNPEIGAYPISAMTPAFCDRFLRRMHAISASRGKRARHALTELMRIAVLHGVFTHNPVREVSALPAATPVKVTYDTEQVTVLMRLLREFEGANPGRSGGARPNTQLVEDVLRIVLGTSARIGEVLAIRERDVTFGERVTLHINGTLIRTTREHAGVDADGNPNPLLRRQNYPKNKKQDRVVHVPDFAVEPLRRLVAGYRENQYELLFTTANLKPRDGGGVRRILLAFREAHEEDLRAMGIDPDRLTPKAFRKTAATVVSREMDMDAAQDLLGHANRATTDIYVTPTRVVSHETADALDRQFSAI